MRKISILMLGLVAAACGKGGDEMSRFHEDGRAKPVVAIAPMMDGTSFDCPWSISEELTSMVANGLAQDGTIFVKAKSDFAFTDNPFGGDLSWIKAQFAPSQEFAVFLELVKHEEIPEKSGPMSPQETAHNLNTAVRLRVVDLRGTTPKIVLQEMVRDSYYIPKTLLPTNYNQVTWGSDDYRTSPMGIAHAHLVNGIVARLNDYILLAKSR
ncbi:MAG TPA: CT253 family lipoprotein [Chlamydiales bacterium]|jgi:hypothetical protein